MIRLLTVIGARPQFIKASALSRMISAEFSDRIQEFILHTGQHYDTNMSEVFFQELGIPEPHIRLNIKSDLQGEQSGLMMQGIEQAILSEKPDVVLVYGDTNSTLAAALSASKLHVPLAHVEAGLRSYNKAMPEEINRIVADHCATFLFAPTETALHNLEKEGFMAAQRPPADADQPLILLSGDVMYDNALYFKDHQLANLSPQLRDMQEREFILLTLHRAENTEDPGALAEILETLDSIAREENFAILFPVHPRTRKMMQAWKIVPGDSIVSCDPLSYFEMMQTERHALMIFTDSGGVQKEACFHGKKCLVLRNETEWTELAEHGMLEVAGVSEASIRHHYELLKSRFISDFPFPYGNGNAARKICSSLIEYL
jgi:UDP-GlcNAc3NAcA epimerase